MLSMIRLQSAPTPLMPCALYLRLEQQRETELHFQNRRKDCKHAWLAPADVAPLEILFTPFNNDRTAGNAATSLGCFL